MVVIDKADDFQIGRVVSRTFSALAQNAVTFLILAAVLMVPVLIANFYFARTAVALTRFSLPGTPQSPAVAMAVLSQTFSTSFWSFLIVVAFTFILRGGAGAGHRHLPQWREAKPGQLPVHRRQILPAADPAGGARLYRE